MYQLKRGHDFLHSLIGSVSTLLGGGGVCGGFLRALNMDPIIHSEEVLALKVSSEILAVFPVLKYNSGAQLGREAGGLDHGLDPVV